MSITSRSTAIGTLCRRPSALLIPLAPVVLLVFAGALAAGRLRTALIGLSKLRSAVDAVATAAPAPQPTTRFTRRSVIGGAAALMGGVLLAASAAGGTFAYLNAQAKASTASISSGTLGITVQAAGTTAGATTAIPTAAWTNMLPGDFAGQTITIANTGSSNASITARLTALTAWDIRIAVGACPTTQLTNSALTTTAVGYGTLAKGTSAVVCVQATLPTGAPASAESTAPNFTITFDSTQVAS